MAENSLDAGAMSISVVVKDDGLKLIQVSDKGHDIRAKVKETMEKAFWDGIIESLKQEEPDYWRIVKLAKEVRDGLCELAPQSWKQEILDSIDLDILCQVLESGTQDTYYIGKILEYALVMLQKLSAPANEDKMKKIHFELQGELEDIAQSDGKCKSSSVLVTIKGLRFVPEQIQIIISDINYQGSLLAFGASGSVHLFSGERNQLQAIHIWDD